MIDKFYKPLSPIILPECYLLLGSNPVPLIKTYLFINQTKIKVVKVGNNWIEDILKDKVYIKGYFYSKVDLSLGLFDEEIVDKDIKLIGKSGNRQFKLEGISIGKTKSYFGDSNFRISKFSALNYEIIVTSSKSKE